MKNIAQSCVNNGGNLTDLRSKLNVLAPAGSSEQLVAAVNNGCDAVYLGLDSFNARMKAPNFTLENLPRWVDYCHLFGVKVYVAINTSVKNDEFYNALKFLYGVYKSFADGVIVTDLALMRIAGTLPKPFDVVASTQLSVHDKYGADFVKKNGATTVVCARECSLKHIKEIAESGLEVECFLHGAMCVCQSGQCLFSSMVGGNSGNRGLCAQPCRKFYSVEDGSVSGYLLSAKDICSLDSWKQLVAAGAATFKIEGRNRRAEYAGITSEIYSEIINGGRKAEKEDYLRLAEMFNRHMSSNGYLNGDNNDIVYPVTQNHTGITVGIISKGQVYTDCTVSKGDGLKIFDGKKEICGGTALESGTRGTFVRAQFSGRVADGMTVNRTTSAELCKNVLSSKKKLRVNLSFNAKAGKQAEIIAKCCGVTVNVKSDFIVQTAKNKPTNTNEIAVQLSKTKDTHYTICDIVIKIDEIFIAKSQINLLRRSVLNKLSSAIIEEYNRSLGKREIHKFMFEQTIEQVGSDSVCKTGVLAVNCYDEYQLKCAEGRADYLIFSPEIIDSNTVKKAIEYNAFLDLPPFADLEYLDGLIGKDKLSVVCNNVGQIEYARVKHLRYIAGAGLNIFNDFIADEFKDAETFAYSHELTLKEISALKNQSGLTFIDGNLILMKLSHCPYKLVYKCDCSSCKADNKLTYVDEMNNKFFISRRRVKGCLFNLVNGKKLSVVNKLKRAGRYLLDYDEEIICHYIQLNNGIDDGYTESKPYTKGRLFDKIN